jgi:hypothetical protein
MSEFIKNTENLNRLLYWLDNGAEHTYFDFSYAVVDVEDEDHEMSYDAFLNAEQSGCGTVACAAGAACLMEIGKFGEPIDWASDDFSWQFTQKHAIRFLGIPESAYTNEAGGLVYMMPVFDPTVAEEHLGREATSADAAAALRSFARCGDPCWEDLADA